VSERGRTKSPARRLGDEWIWVGFRSGAPSEHAGLELERLHVDELARLLLQAAEFRLRAGLDAERCSGAAQDAAALSDPRPVRRLEFEAWRSALEEQFEALQADGATLSPRLAELVGACLASGAGVGAVEVSAVGVSAAAQPDSGPAELCGRRAHSAATHSAATHSAATAWPSREVPAARELGTREPGVRQRPQRMRDSAAPLQRAEPALSRWPTARELAQAARVLAPSARSHCALGRAHRAADDLAAARGCFRAALASTADERLLREAQVALDELCSPPRTNTAVGAEGLGAVHVPVSHR